MAGLYIHIPFCLSKCNYCDFLSITFDESVARKYIEALLREIRLRGGRKIDTIYIGGGTPTVLHPDHIAQIFKTLSDYFEITRDAEITIEANAGTLNANKSRALASLGINRLSVGIQSFHDEELRFLGRCHTAEEAIQAVESPGFDNFSLDLIYGIPGQSMLSWQSTLTRALAVGPTHISAYELTAEPGTPFYEGISSGNVEIPQEETVVEMFERGLEAMENAGLMHYEISNFASPGMECRHNLNYWKRGEYIGIGAGAHSFENGKRSRNTGYVFKYIELLSTGALPVEEVSDISPDEEIKELIFLGLRMTRGLDVGKMGFVADAAGELIEDGLMLLKDGRLRLTRKGLLLANAVVVSLFEKLGLG